MTNYLLILLLFCFFGTSLMGQTGIELNIEHKFDKSTYVPGQVYIDNNNKAILINRIEYYLSDIELVYDAGQTVLINNQHLLIDGETQNYDIGAVSSTLHKLETINFNLGVHSFSNLNSPSLYSPGHPLSAVNMYSQGEQSYIFIAIEGMTDSDGDQIPDKAFELHATGNNLLRSISIDAETASENNILKINLIANIANFLKDIDLENAGIQENGNSLNEKLCDNTEDYSVFSNVSTTGVSTLVSPKNEINIDSRLSIAPTIHYKFFTSEQLNMTITNINGSYFIQRFNLAPEGNFYMSQDLASGLYIVIFTTPKGIRQCERFVIRN
jgi:hypothetical protein